MNSPGSGREQDKQQLVGIGYSANVGSPLYPDCTPTRGLTIRQIYGLLIAAMLIGFIGGQTYTNIAIVRDLQFGGQLMGETLCMEHMLGPFQGTRGPGIKCTNGWLTPDFNTTEIKVDRI